MPRYGPTGMTGARGPLLLLSLSRIEQCLRLRHDWTARHATMGRVEPVIILPLAPRNRGSGSAGIRVSRAPCGPAKDFLITHEPQPISGADTAWAWSAR